MQQRELTVAGEQVRWLEEGEGHPVVLPARVVWGEADRFQKIEYGRRLAADLGTTLQPIPGGRHFTPEDHPDVLAAAIDDLLPDGSGAQ